jgi:hypothetical protein
MPSKRSRDPNQLAKMIVGISTGEIEDTISSKKKRPTAQRAGGLADSKARAKKLTPEERRDIARIAHRHAGKRAARTPARQPSLRSDSTPRPAQNQAILAFDARQQWPQVLAMRFGLLKTL